MRKPKLGILVSHPIQYHTPLFRKLAQDLRIELKVYFCHDHGVRPSFDPQFQRVIQFDVPQLEGYAHEFLPNLHPNPTTAPFRLINPSIAGVLLRGDCDVLVVHGYNSLSAMIAFLGPHGPTKLFLRGESNLVRQRSVAIRMAKELYLRVLFGRVDHFLAIGQLNAAYYEAYGVSRKKISVAPYSVDTELFSAASTSEDERRATRRNYGLPVEGLLVLFVGKFMPLKRPLDVIRAVGLAPADVSISLALVGAGELENEIKGEIERTQLHARVHLLGFRNQTELPDLYKCADVLVLASDRETWGIVVNESMAAGVVPVVTDQVGCGPDLVDPSCIYPVGDVSALGAILVRMASDQTWFSEQRARSQARIADCSLSATAEEFVQAVLRCTTTESSSLH